MSKRITGLLVLVLMCALSLWAIGEEAENAESIKGEELTDRAAFYTITMIRYQMEGTDEALFI